MKLSKTSKDKLEELCSSAMAWGWQQDQGTGSQVDRSEKQFKDAVKGMTRRLLSLEEQIKKEKVINQVNAKKIEDTERRLRRAKRASPQGYVLP